VIQMTDRKPPELSFPDWVDLQVRTAEARGAFENLPGKGKPIAGIDRPLDEMAWIAGWLRRENVAVADVLPPSLQLAKEVEDLPVRLQRERTEAGARRVIEDLNARIDAAYAAPAVGPPLRVKLVKVDEALDQWRAARAETEPPHSPS
jgi:hypothetical protein